MRVDHVLYSLPADTRQAKYYHRAKGIYYVGLVVNSGLDLAGMYLVAGGPLGYRLRAFDVHLGLELCGVSPSFFRHVPLCMHSDNCDDCG